MSGRIAKSLRDLQSLFGAPKEAVATNASPRASTDPETPGDLDTSQQAQQKLKAIWRERGTVGVGHIAALGLDKLREEMGADWARVSERVCQTTEGILNKRLIKGDMFVRQGELGYVVLFAELTGDLAEAKMAMLANEILGKLFGEDRKTSSISISSCAMDVESEVALEGIDPVEIILERLEKLPKTELSAKGRVPPSISTGERLSSATAASESIEMRYHGIWNVKKRALLAYVCWPVSCKHANGSMVPLDGAPSMSAAETLRVDLLVLQKAAACFRDMEDFGRKLQLVVPVHFETFADPRLRRHMIETYKKLDGEFMRYMTLELVGAPDGVPSSRLMEVCIALRPFVRQIHFRYGARSDRRARLQGTGIHAAGFDIAAEHVGDASAMKQITAFAGAMSTAGLRSYVYGIDCMSLATSAVCAGIDNVSGKFASPVDERSIQAYRFDPQDMVAQFFKAQAS